MFTVGGVRAMKYRISANVIRRLPRYLRRLTGMERAGEERTSSGELGRAMGLPEALVNRQPFPGPGLAIRVIGEVTREKIAALQDADAIFRAALEKSGVSKDIGQYFAVLTNTRSVGVMGDGRTYDYTLALRAVTTDDFMTAKWARIPYELLDAISGDIINHVKGINRVVYDITSKPPATIEWE